jgi:predicted lipoprotein with Yx(FWY)xxD motif
MRAKLLALTTTLALSMGAASTAAAAPSDTDADDAARVSGGDGGGTTVYDFDDDNVDGEILSPDGANVNSRARVKHASLITIRPHFISELISLSFDI